MGRSCPVLILLFLAASVTSLHIGHSSFRHATVQSELQALKAQQSSFENQVNSLISNISALDAKVKGTSNVSEKVVMLENAIISERETVFALSNSILPPFNLSKNACQQLTNQQKINLLEQVAVARRKVQSIKKLAASIPPCDEIKMINADVAKQTVLLDSIEKAIYTKCDASIVLSPTIFQSNIYATNWILGSQTIDDLIEEYYQRSVQYDNITNCPLEYPFFDGQQCIACNQPKEVFNMFKKHCELCPYDTQINTGLRICQQIPHYSDYTKSSNYNLDGASGLPTPDPKLTPCPEKTPFWNGTNCVTCRGGRWWSVKDNICKSCPAGQVFDSNLKTCLTPKGINLLTVLENNNWVTGPGNFTNVLKERAKIVDNSNGSTLQYCSADSPYFDGIECISCDKQFDLTTLKCVSAPQGSQYDDNLHNFVPTQQNKETNVKANNILTSGVLVNSPVPDCDLTAPFFDGIACIQCPEPFILFDVSSKKCVACQSTEIFNNTSHKCEKRPTVFISTNFNKLIATPKVSIDNYKKELLNKVKDNQNYIVDQCKDARQYSNFTTCFVCRDVDYFNVQTKSCMFCNGTIDPTNNYCIPKSTLITNLTTAPNLILPDKKTLKDLSDQQSQILGPVQSCPQKTPYAVAGTSCTACTAPTPYFDLKLQKCAACAANTFYNSKLRICEQGVFVSNLNALDKYVQAQNYTISNIKKQIEEIKKTKPIIQCPQDSPFFDGKKCSSCTNGTYVNLKTFACVTPVLVTNTDALNELDNVFEQGNYTVEDIAAQISKNTQPTASCNKAKPLYNGKQCISCPEDKYYKLKTSECVEGVTVSNVAQLKKLKNVKETDNYTIANIEKQINASTRPTVSCNQTKPLFDGKKCISCDAYSIYDLKASNCIPPQMYTNTTALKTLKYIELEKSTLASIDTQNGKIPTPKKPCPADSPLFNKKQCISCPNGTYYNLQTLACYTPLSVTNVDALRKSNNFVEVDNYTLANIQKLNSQSVLPTVSCDSSRPLFDGKQCIVCPNSLYNLKLLTCFNCSSQEYYNKTTNKCTPKPHFYPNLTNSNWIVGDAKGIDRVINLTATRKQMNDSTPCPQFSEFFNNNTFECQACPNGTYFNYDTYSCATCAPQQTVDPNTHKCAVRMANGIFQTNLNSPNLIFNGISLGEWQDIQASNKTKYPNIKDCPSDKPYFDGFDCITCHPFVPYFNIDNLLCQNCGEARYDSQRKECVLENTVVTTSPNIAKMYSSIF